MQRIQDAIEFMAQTVKIDRLRKQKQEEGKRNK